MRTMRTSHGTHTQYSSCSLAESPPRRARRAMMAPEAVTVLPHQRQSVACVNPRWGPCSGTAHVCRQTGARPATPPGPPPLPVTAPWGRPPRTLATKPTGRGNLAIGPTSSAIARRGIFVNHAATMPMTYGMRIGDHSRDRERSETTPLSRLLFRRHTPAFRSPRAELAVLTAAFTHCMRTWPRVRNFEGC